MLRHIRAGSTASRHAHATVVCWSPRGRTCAGFASARVTLSVALAGVSGEPAPPLDADVLACLQTVFRGGGLSMQAFAKQCPTLHDLVGLPWFQRDLPAGAVDMPEQYRDETEQRRNSEGYAAVRATLDNL